MHLAQLLFISCCKMNIRKEDDETKLHNFYMCLLTVFKHPFANEFGI